MDETMRRRITDLSYYINREKLIMDKQKHISETRIKNYEQELKMLEQIQEGVNERRY